MAGHLATNHKCEQVAKYSDRNHVTIGGGAATFCNAESALQAIKHTEANMFSDSCKQRAIS